MQKWRYPNLAVAMMMHRVTRAEIAKALNISERTLYAKMIGEREFTLSQVKIIGRQFFPTEYLEKLFYEEAN